MGKSAPSAPAAPSPASVSEANDTSALYNATLEDVNQSSPLGTETFTQTPAPSTTAGTGAPTISEQTTYAPQVQQLLNTTEGNMNSLANTASGLEGQIQTAASTPVDYSSFTPIPTSGDLQGQQTSAFNAEMAQLQPLISQQQEATNASLTNEGFTQGSQGWNQGQYTTNAGINNLEDQALVGAQNYASTANATALADRNQQIAEAYQQQSEPINEYSALMGDTQVQAPSFTGAPSSSNPAASVPAAGNELEQQYAQQMQAYNAQVASQNSTSMGLFGLGGSLGSAAIDALPTGA